MCDPVSIGSAIVMAVGTVAQQRSQARAQSKMKNAIRNNAAEAERIQKDSQARTLGAAEEGFSRDNFDKNVDAQTDMTKQQFLASQSNGVLPGEYYGESTGDNVKQYQEQKSASTSANTATMAAKLAKLRGFEGGMRIGNAGNRAAAEQIQLNNNKIAGNNAVLPVALQAAQMSGANPMADIMVGAGSAGLSAGLGGYTFGGAPANAAGGVAGKTVANPALKGTKYILA